MTSAQGGVKGGGSVGGAAVDVFGAEGEMSARMRALDWSATPLGPPETWPNALRTTVRIMLSSRYPMFVWWGRELTNIYNDGYIPVLGTRHPWALGRAAPEIWSEIWGTVGPLADSVLREGRASWNESTLLLMERNGYTEETYFTFSYSPAPDDRGGIGGVFCACTEDTQRILSERRLRALRDLAEGTAEAKSAEDACTRAARILGEHPLDVPFCVVYLRGDDGATARLAGASGIEPESEFAPREIAIGDAGAAWPLACEACVVSGLRERAHLPGGPWPEGCDAALVLPISKAGQEEPTGYVVAGISPRRELDGAYRDFFNLMAGTIAAAVANARAYEEEQARVRALAELDRAKTAFFSNVSHEFRTPLTLMLGPLEEILRRPEAASGDLGPQLELVHRNGLRLLKLVNTLLDFTRIEAGRVRATFEPTNLAATTADLASTFRAAVESAGLRLRIECKPLPEPVYVDREMWEKVVLNLLSNAFKFTWEGEIAVEVGARDGLAAVTVRDTGVGIPQAELPRVFDRFHRVAGVLGRTHEGSGIGLSLVQEVVKLHGGRLEVESTEGSGSVFRVLLPLGHGHLPLAQIATSEREGASPAQARVFASDISGWMNGDTELAPREGTGEGRLAGTRVLLADDNADMRAYISRLLADEGCEVTAVEDGQRALEEARARRPDLVLTDVMMPRLDGFGLVRAVRASPALACVPVIMLSARAGEESRIEGMEAAADDYLVKPFAARELIARVSAAIHLARARTEAETARAGVYALLRQVADAVPLKLAYVGTDLRYEFVNRRHMEWFGRPESEIVGRPVAEVIGAWAYETVRPMLERALAGEQVTFEVAVPHTSGAARHLRTTLAPDVDPWGRTRGVVVSAIDVTEHLARERTLLLLWEIDRATRSLSEPSEIAATIARLLGEAMGVNRCAYAEVEEDEDAFLLTGNYTNGVGSIVGRYRFVDFGEQVRTLMRENRPYVIRDIEAEAPPGMDIGPYVATEIRSVICVPLHKDGRLAAAMAVHCRTPREWTALEVDLVGAVASRCWESIERVRVERSLRQSEAAFRQLAESMPQIVWTARADGRVDYFNHRWFAMTGLSRESPEGASFEPVLHPDDRERCLERWRRSVETGEPFDIECRLLDRRTGTYRWQIGRAVPSRDETGRIVKWFGSCTDIEDQKRAEGAVREARERLEATLAAAEVATWTLDIDRGLIAWDKGVASVFGAVPGGESGAPLAAAMDAIHPEDRDRVMAALGESIESGRTYEVECRVTQPDGSARWVVARGRVDRSDEGRPTEISGILLDVTARKQAEERVVAAKEEAERLVAERTRELEASYHRLRMSERMASLGTLSAGLGHDMGNLLVPVRVRLESLASADLSPELREDVEAIRTSAEYLQRLASGLRMLAIDPERSHAGDITELSAWWRDAASVMRNALPRGVTLSSRMLEAPCWVSIGKSGLTQAVFNLVQNAGDALRGSTSGRVDVWAEVADGNVRVGVTDNGPGMSEEVRARCMEPFYTTKSRGISTGIGLSLVYGIVKDAGGRIELTSERGQGTTFVLELRQAAPPREMREGERRTAVVDIEDPRLRAFVTAELKHLSFDVRGGPVEEPAHLWVVQDEGAVRPAPEGTVVVLLADGAEGVRAAGRAVVVGRKPRPAALREAVRQAAGTVRAT